jgi:sodium/potassium-transporting ATPase subunit alpha
MSVTTCSIGAQKIIHAETHRTTLPKHPYPTSNALDQLAAVAGLCNTGEFDAATTNLPLEERVIIGDATDQAVLRFAERLTPVAALRNAWKKVFEIAFNSRNKFMVRVLEAVEEGVETDVLAAEECEGFREKGWLGALFLTPLRFKNFVTRTLTRGRLLTIKGAPDVLIDRCESYVHPDGSVFTLDGITRNSIEEIKDTWSSQGMRVILLARRILPQKDIKFSPTSAAFERDTLESAKTGLTLVGLVGIIDPPV